MEDTRFRNTFCSPITVKCGSNAAEHHALPSCMKGRINTNARKSHTTFVCFSKTFAVMGRIPSVRLSLLSSSLSSARSPFLLLLLLLSVSSSPSPSLLLSLLLPLTLPELCSLYLSFSLVLSLSLSFSHFLSLSFSFSLSLSLFSFLFFLFLPFPSILFTLFPFTYFSLSCLFLIFSFPFSLSRPGCVFLLDAKDRASDGVASKTPYSTCCGNNYHDRHHITTDKNFEPFMAHQFAPHMVALVDCFFAEARTVHCVHTCQVHASHSDERNLLMTLVARVISFEDVWQPHAGLLYVSHISSSATSISVLETCV